MHDAEKRLPRLDPLIAFEAAARLSSFALAAKELNVTAPAVSQQIRGLEASLGIRLFERKHRSIQLTDRGRAFQNSVSIALTHLVSAFNEVKFEQSQENLTIITDESIAAMWLIPKLHGFEKKYPNCSIEIKTSDVQSSLLDSDFQLAIIHGEGRWIGYQSALLFKEEVFPVCAPDFLKRYPEGLSLELLQHADLLDLEYEQWQWMNWSIWFTEMQIMLPRTQRKMKSNNYPLLIDVARKGLGVALGWGSLVDPDLESGALVRPFPNSVKTQNGYYIVWPFNHQMSPIESAFRDWCLSDH